MAVYMWGVCQNTMTRQHSQDIWPSKVKLPGGLSVPRNPTFCSLFLPSFFAQSSSNAPMSKEIRSPRPYTSEAECLQYHSQLFSTFAAGKTKSIKWRKWQLKQMWWMLVDNEKAIAEALAADLGRHEFEALTSDLH